MVINDDTNTLSVDWPYLLVGIDITIESEHIEQHINCKDWIAAGMEEACFHFLFSDLIIFEELGLHINEV